MNKTIINNTFWAGCMYKSYVLYSFWGDNLFLKTAVKPPQLEYLEEVHGRTHLTESDRRKYFNLKLGYEGERKVYNYLNQFKQGVCIWDVRLDICGEVQYDFFVIVNGKIFVLEIKNFYGNYTFKKGNLKSESGFRLARCIFSVK